MKLIEPIRDGDPPWLVLAIQEASRGVREVRGTEDDPRILEYWSVIPQGRHPKGELRDEVPWCSVFACYVMEQSGFRSPRRAMARSWMSWGRALDRPERGCMVVFWRGDADAMTGHVAIYLDSTAHAVRCIGGNQRSAVSIARYPLSQLLGYRLPAISDRLTPQEPST